MTYQLPQPISRDDTEHGKEYCLYSDAQAAYAAGREAMRAECVKVCNKNSGFFEGAPRESLHPLHQREMEISEDIAKAIKEIP